VRSAGEGAPNNKDDDDDDDDDEDDDDDGDFSDDDGAEDDDNDDGFGGDVDNDDDDDGGLGAADRSVDRETRVTPPPPPPPLRLAAEVAFASRNTAVNAAASPPRIDGAKRPWPSAPPLPLPGTDAFTPASVATLVASPVAAAAAAGDTAT
jgi:hypothetical protein